MNPKYFKVTWITREQETCTNQVRWNNLQKNFSWRKKFFKIVLNRFWVFAQQGAIETEAEREIPFWQKKKKNCALHLFKN